MIKVESDEAEIGSEGRLDQDSSTVTVLYKYCHGDILQSFKGDD